MSTDFSVRPVGTPVALPVVQQVPVAQPAPVVPPASETTVKAVATELPASQTVTVADPSVAARNDAQAARESVSRQAFIDLAAASIVYQVVDTRTNLVVQQFPDEAVLRRRAYFHTLDLTRGTLTRPLATDRRA
jgi:hypothetical protein